MSDARDIESLEPEEPVKLVKPEDTDPAPSDAESQLERVPTSRSIIDFPESVYIQSTLETYMFVILGSVATMISTISIPIYLPALYTLADYFETSVEKINLTATMYSIFQGVSPLVWATLSDAYGRRPIFLVCLAINIGANIGLALGNSYWLLFGLRCVQAFGGAATVSLSFGVIGDITQRKNRGGLMAMTNGLGLIGNCFGPLIGGALLHKWGWRGIFWFLVILAVVAFVTLFVCLPETNRHFAGNGSVMPTQFLTWSPYSFFRRKAKGIPYAPSDPEYAGQWMPPPYHVHYLRWLYLFTEPDVIIILVPMSIFYTTWYMVLTVQSTYLETRYGMSVQNVGFTYLASGIGTFCASMGASRLMQRIYRREHDKFLKDCEQKGIPAKPSQFNVYYARLSLSFYAAGILIATTLIFGWTLEYHVTFYVPVIMTFFISASTSYVMSTTNTLLVDLFPDDAATAISCSNLTRCLLCAAGLAAVDRMTQAMKPGPAFTLLSGLCGLSMLCLVAELKFGHSFAERRRQRERAKAAKKMAKMAEEAK